MDWPRLALFDDRWPDPTFGIYQKDENSKILLVNDKPENAIAEIKDLKAFCIVFKMNYPPYFVEPPTDERGQEGGV
jgi:hypothetical protein